MNIVHEIGLPIAVLIQFSSLANTTFAVVGERMFPPPIEGHAYVIEAAPAGETALIAWTITKRTDCPGQNTRVWNGAGGFHLTEPLRPTSLPTSLTPATYTIPTPVPDYAPPGTLHLTIEGFYQCVGGPRTNFTLGPVTLTVPEAELQGD